MLRLAGLLAFAFWIWMLVDCARSERNRLTWIWLMVLFPLPCTLIYFIVHKLPTLRFSMPGSWSLGGEIRRAEEEVRNIGNSYQYCALGDLLLKARRKQEALEAYLAAIEREPDCLPALFGSGSILFEQEKYNEASPLLERVLAIDPEYKFGRVAGVYCRVLVGCGELDAAVKLLQTDPHLCFDPATRIFLAGVLTRQGNTEQARQTLLDVIVTLQNTRGMDARIQRKDAERLLKTLK